MLMLVADDCHHEDLSHDTHASCKEEVARFYADLVASMPERVKVVVDDITLGDETKAGLMWHMEVNGVEVPCSRGLSFYRVRPHRQHPHPGPHPYSSVASYGGPYGGPHPLAPPSIGSGLITYVRQSPEHFIKLSSMVLSASASATPLIDSLGPMAMPSFWTNLARGATNMLASAPPVEELLMHLSAAGASNTVPSVPGMLGGVFGSHTGAGSPAVSPHRPTMPAGSVFSTMPAGNSGSPGGVVHGSAFTGPAPAYLPTFQGPSHAASLTPPPVSTTPVAAGTVSSAAPPTVAAYPPVTAWVPPAAAAAAATVTATNTAAAPPLGLPASWPPHGPSPSAPPAAPEDNGHAGSSAACDPGAAAANASHAASPSIRSDDFTLSALYVQNLLQSGGFNDMTAVSNATGGAAATAAGTALQTPPALPRQGGNDGFPPGPELMAVPAQVQVQQAATVIPAAPQGVAAVPLSCLAGIWEKDLHASDESGYEKALDLWQISGVHKATAKLIEGLELTVGSGRSPAFNVHFLTIIPYFKVTETYPLGGGRSKMRRRDQRSGNAQAYAEALPNGVVCRASWGAPFAGELEESYVLPDPAGKPDVMHVTSTIRIGGKEASTLQVYNRRRNMSARDLISASEKRNGKANDVLRRFGMA